MSLSASGKNSPVFSSTYLIGMNFWWKIIYLSQWGVLTPTMRPISLRIMRPKGTSSQKKRAYLFKTTSFGFSGFLGTIGKGTREYPKFVLKILFKFDLSVTWPSYMEQIRSPIGIT